MTGGNRSLGFETCRQLAQLGLTAILSARYTTKGEIAAKQLIGRGLDVVFQHLDVSDQSHLDHDNGKQFTSKILKRFLEHNNIKDKPIPFLSTAARKSRGI